MTLTSAGLPVGCTLTAGVVQCVSGQAASGASDTYDFSGTLNPSLTVPQTATVTMVGNEHDPSAANDVATLTFAPTAQDRSTSGTGTASQQTTVAKPGDATLRLVDANGQQVTTVTVPGQGTYTANPTTGVISFAPVLGFSGPADAVDFVIVPGTGATASGSYAATVAKPAAPAAAPLATTDVAPASQSVTVTPPAGGSVRLLDGDGVPATSVSTAQGTYVLDTATGVITFTPAAGYSGTTDGVTYRVTDAYAQSTDADYVPVVQAPAPPSPSDRTTTVTGSGDQSTTVVVPAGGSVRLVDADGDPATTVTTAQGTYVLDPATGVITFTPVRGFSGTADPVTFRVTDAYGQHDDAVYTPTVVLPAAPAPADVTTTGAFGAVEDTADLTTDDDELVLLQPDGTTGSTLEVAGKGTFAVVGSGPAALRFTPDKLLRRHGGRAVPRGRRVRPDRRGPLHGHRAGRRRAHGRPAHLDRHRPGGPARHGADRRLRQRAAARRRAARPGDHRDPHRRGHVRRRGRRHHLHPGRRLLGHPGSGRLPRRGRRPLGRLDLHPDRRRPRSPGRRAQEHQRHRPGHAEHPRDRPRRRLGEPRRRPRRPGHHGHRGARRHLRARPRDRRRRLHPGCRVQRHGQPGDLRRHRPVRPGRDRRLHPARGQAGRPAGPAGRLQRSGGRGAAAAGHRAGGRRRHAARRPRPRRHPRRRRRAGHLRARPRHGRDHLHAGEGLPRHARRGALPDRGRLWPDLGQPVRPEGHREHPGRRRGHAPPDGPGAGAQHQDRAGHLHAVDRQGA
nr:hypothetical protein [Angustibacter aerolatus]